MNIQINISLNSGTLQNTDGQDIVLSSNQFDYDFYLDPFYATENDILCVFMDEYDDYIARIRKMIFEGSVKIHNILTEKLRKQLGMSVQEAFLFKRQYVICYSIYNFSKIFYREYLTSVKKSKFLADVKISLEVEKDPSLIANIGQDAKDCMKDLEAMLGTAGGLQFMTFVKGECNSNNQVSFRMWFPTLGSNYPRIPVASDKYAVGNNLYKIGSQS